MTTDVRRIPDEAHQLVEASRRLFEAGVMSHSGHANLSVRLDADRFMLTPGFVRGLRPEDLATVSLDGQVLEGELRSVSMEIIAMHSAVYRARPQVGAVIHTHSPSATAFAVAHRPLPCRTEPMLRFGQAEDVPVVPWGPRGSDVSVRGVVDALTHSPTTAAVLLANHGLLVFGPDPRTPRTSWWPSRRAPGRSSPRRRSAGPWTSPRARWRPYGPRSRGWRRDGGGRGPRPAGRGRTRPPPRHARRRPGRSGGPSGPGPGPRPAPHGGGGRRAAAHRPHGQRARRARTAARPLRAAAGPRPGRPGADPRPGSTARRSRRRRPHRRRRDRAPHRGVPAYALGIETIVELAHAEAAEPL